MRTFYPLKQLLFKSVVYPLNYFEVALSETFEKCSISFKFKEGDNFNHRNTLSISRIALKLHFVPKFEPDAEIGRKGVFFKGLGAGIKAGGSFWYRVAGDSDQRNSEIPALIYPDAEKEFRG